jgi:hypothetical protein
MLCRKLGCYGLVGHQTRDVRYRNGQMQLVDAISLFRRVFIGLQGRKLLLEASQLDPYLVVRFTALC